MKSQPQLRREILGKVAEFYRAGIKKTTDFIPAKTIINYSGRVYDEKELINLVDASLDFWLTAGRFAREFEKKLADFLSVKFCLLTNSGSSANLLAISALTSPLLKSRQLKSGDEVITTACGFPTTLNPILQNNLKPVFIDVKLGTYNIDADKIEKAISRRTKAIFVAHTLGNPVNLDKICKITKKYNLWFIEDNSDALGALYKNKYTGTFSHIATCSFYPAHHLCMGEGGVVLTNNAFLRRIIMSFRDWGRDCYCDPGRDNTCGNRFSQKFGELPYGYDHKYVYAHIGYNLKATDMQAAVGVAQLKKLPKFIRARKKNFEFLYRVFKAYEKYFILPEAEINSEPSWFGFPVLVRDSAPFSRADIVSYLEKNKISTRMLFGGNLTKQPAYQNMKFRVVGGLANTDLVMNKLFWIGVYPGLTQEKLQFMAQKLSELFNKYE